jgi:hypothetical protein
MLLCWTETNKCIYCIGMKQIYVLLCLTATNKFIYRCVGLKQINLYTVVLEWTNKLMYCCVGLQQINLYIVVLDWNKIGVFQFFNTTG